MSGSHLTSRLVPAACLIAALALPFVAPTYYVQFASKAMIMGMLAMALNLAVGQGGMVSLCHAAFFGLAGYVLALVAGRYDPPSLLTTLPVAVAASAFAALVIGALALRTRGVYFIMVTLAFGEMLFYFFHDTKFAGGSDGAFVYFKPVLEIAGVTLLDLDKPSVFYFVVLALLVGTIALLTMLARSPFGHALSAARDNERRQENVHRLARTLIRAPSLAGVAAGLAKCMQEDFGIDAALIGIGAAHYKRHDIDGIVSIEAEGRIARAFEDFFRTRLIECGPIEADKARLLFPKAAEIRSAAIVPLEKEKSLGFVALGSRDAERFAPRQGKLFLELTADLVAAAVRART